MSVLREAQRLTVYPIRHGDVWDMNKKQQASFWTPDEIDFSDDRRQYNDLLNDAERTFVKHILAFFAGTDTIVALNITNNFCKEVTMLEAQHAYRAQAMIEDIHGETYSMMIDTFITDPEERTQLFDNMGNVKSVLMKMDWADRWSLNSDDTPLSKRLIAFAIVEGIFFSGAFCAIYWLKQRNLMPGLTKSNEFIARDEGMHTDFACLLYSKLTDDERLPMKEVQDLFLEAVAVEKEFINESIPCRMIGMNADMMSTYIEFVADNLFEKLGYTLDDGAKLFGSHNPFPFMDLIGMVGRSNFFEERVSQYQRAGVQNEAPQLEYNDEF